MDAVMERINNGDTVTALALISIVGVEHLLSVARPGPASPIWVHQDLAACLRFDLVGEMLVSEEVNWMVERESDASAD